MVEKENVDDQGKSEVVAEGHENIKHIWFQVEQLKALNQILLCIVESDIEKQRLRDSLSLRESKSIICFDY